MSTNATTSKPAQSTRSKVPYKKKTNRQNYTNKDTYNVYPNFRRKTPVYNNKPITAQVRLQKKVSTDYALNYMSPFNKTSPPFNPNSLGNYTTIPRISRQTITTFTDTPVILVYQPSCRGIWQQIVIKASNTEADIQSLGHSSSPLWRFSQTGETAPISVKPLRAGIKVKNTTENQLIGGAVRCLQMSSPIEWDWQAGNAIKITTALRDELLAMARNSPKSVEYTGLNLAREESEWVIAPCTSAAYNSYGSQFFIAGNSGADVEAGLSAFSHDMSMNNFIMVFEPSSSPQTYSITYGLQIAARYPANTILGENSRPHVSTGSSQSMAEFHEAVNIYGGKKKLPSSMQ